MVKPTVSLCGVMLLLIVCITAGAPNWAFMSILAGLIMTHLLEIEQRRG
jgi:hypothetical protein